MLTISALSSWWRANPRAGQAISVACLWLVATGCNNRNAFKPPPPPEVTRAHPTVRDVEDWVEFTGTTKATATVELRARVKGYLKEIYFDDGAQVKEGQLLFLIEQEPFLAEQEAARANLAKAKAATELALANLARTTQLVEKNAASRQQLDVDSAELETAKANERVSAASVTQADLNLSYSKIHAPIAGRIGRHLVDKGNLILPDQSLLAVIEKLHPIHAYFYLSERELLRFMKMVRLKELPDPETSPPELFLGLEDETGFPHRGKLDFRQKGVDPGTGTVERRGEFENEDLTLMPGMFVRIRAAVGKPKQRMLVEERALGADQRGDYVLVIGPKNVVEQRRVKLGILDAGMRVVEEGLSADEWIIVNGLQRARPGSTVTIKEPEEEQPAATPVAATKPTPELRTAAQASP